MAGGTPLRLRGADGVTIAADAYGEEGGVPILFLHGGGQSRSAWRGAARTLAGQGYRSLSLDIRGHGESDWAPDGNYAFDRYVADLEAVIDGLGRPAVLVGASLGGHVATVAAADLPDRVLALALADVTPFLDEDEADDMRGAMRRSALGFDTVEEAAAMVDILRGTPPRGDPAGLRRHMREGEDGRLYWRWDPRFIEDRFVRHGGEGGLFAQAAAALRVPTLLMRAEFSTVVTHQQVARFHEVVPGLIYEQIAGVGHMVTGDDNGAYVPSILRFLAGLDTSPA
jgi:pimeloyl-ACP methyl ester carboxylesterase